MNIGLTHFYSDQNIGDAAILAGLRSLCASVDPNASVTISNPEESAQADALIAVGGDIFNNGRPRLITRRFLAKLRALSVAPERHVIFGQSIPPSCRGVALRLLARRQRSLAGVWLRDTTSVERMRALGVDARLTVDAAFALTRADADIVGARACFAALGVAPEQAALLSIRGFNRMYPVDEARFLDRMTEAARRFEAAGLRPVLLAQAQVDAADSDLTGAKALMARVPSLALFDPFQDGQANWRLAFGAIAEAGAVLGTRYHMAVLRMAAGRTPFGLWYSNKGEDLTGRLGVPGAPAGDFDPAQAVARAISARDEPFDAQVLRARLFSDFAAAMAPVGASAGIEPMRAAG